MLTAMQGCKKRKKKKKEYLLSRPGAQESGIYSFQDDFIWHWPSSLSQEKGAEAASAKMQKCIPKRAWRHCKVSSQFKGHHRVLLGNVQQTRKVTLSQSMAPLKALSYNPFLQNNLCCITHFKEETENSAEEINKNMRLFPQIPASQRVKQTLCIWFIHRAGSVGTCPQPDLALGKSFYTAKALTLGKCKTQLAGS